ncbi:hypothetical protein FGADI_3424 [Fusarium gaditjirri]|uniref:Uncharacterized protein n=1 Tax=Fusarium gaditjirri TaxID=282569 RepID=A0A8H4TFU2_9HYPO|nr:hypothetical protein FGADI_3424 [Fusarium gaditjirri]
MWKGPADHVEGESPIFHVVVGTKTSGDKTGSIYTARIDPCARNPWSRLGFPAQASGLDQLSPMALPGGESAMVSVFHDTVSSKPPRCVGHVFGPDGGFLRQFEAKAGVLKGVNSVFSHLNPWNTTDLVLAGNDGIGICDSTQEYDAMSEHMLKGIAFKQVVCDEAEDSSRPLTHTRLAIFAVSKDDELYYIDGERNYAADEPRMSFQWSGLPIRRNVSQISTRYNALQCSSELLMATENDTALRFLRREPSGKSWTEDRVTLKGHKTMRFDAFVTNLVFTDGFGKPVPENYKVKLTSEPLHIVANDRSYATGLKVTVLKTDRNGSILIVIPTNGKIACPPLNLSISDFCFKVDPAQRVDRLIGGLNSKDAFSAAKASNGEMIFAGCSSETLTDAASVLGKYGDIKASIHEPSQSRSLDIDLSSGRGNYEWGSWFDNVTSWAEKFLGDCIESIKYVAKETVKMAIRIAGPVVKLVFKIGKALCSFVVKTLDTVLTAVANFLETTLGLDFLSRLLKFLKAVFDPAAVKATQEVVKKAIIGSISLSERFISVNRASMEDLLGDAEDMLKGYLGDPKDLPGGNSSAPNVSSILNNPVIRLISKIDPLSWLMEAITEEFTDFKVPSFAALTDGIIKAISPNLINNFSLISKLWDIFFQELCTVLSNPSQLLPALIRALKTVALKLTKVIKEAILSLFDLLLTILHELPLILSSSWKLGGLTDIWEELTGQEFSVMNFLTYPIAVIMNVTSVLSSGKLPFEGQTAALARFNFDSVVIKPFYESTRDLKTTTSSMEIGGQWGREDVHKTRAQSSQLNHLGGLKMGYSGALASPPLITYANNDSSTISAKEIFRNLCTIAENFSRIAISLDLLLEGGRIQDRRQRLIDDYAAGAVTEARLHDAIAAQDARPTGYNITKWRILGIFFHSVAIIGGTLLHERSNTKDWTFDSIIGVVGVGEFVVAAASLCGANVEMSLQGAGSRAFAVERFICNGGDSWDTDLYLYQGEKPYHGQDLYSGRLGEYYRGHSLDYSFDNK